MTLALDGFDILRRIGLNAEAFGSLRSTVAEIAETLVRSQLTAKTLDVSTFRSIVIALGDDTVSLVLQTLTSDELLALARRLDPHNAKLKSRDGAWVEGHLLDLAHYRLDPAKRTVGATKRASKPAAPTQRRKAANPLGTGSMAAKEGS
jgi:hypothetical protein